MYTGGENFVFWSSISEGSAFLDVFSKNAKNVLLSRKVGGGGHGLPGPLDCMGPSCDQRCKEITNIFITYVNIF